MGIPASQASSTSSFFAKLIGCTRASSTAEQWGSLPGVRSRIPFKQPFATSLRALSFPDFVCFVTGAERSWYLINNSSWAVLNSTFVFINASAAVPNSTFVSPALRAVRRRRYRQRKVSFRYSTTFFGEWHPLLGRSVPRDHQSLLESAAGVSWLSFDGVFGTGWPTCPLGAACAGVARVDRRVTGERVCLRTKQW